MDAMALIDVLPAVRPTDGLDHELLTLVPLAGGGERFQGYLLACEAIDEAKLTVTEVDECGSVPELLAENAADRPVLLIDGEELLGAKQNRVLNTSVLLPPVSRLRIPVSCVEEGRWQQSSRSFRSGHFSPGSLRQRKSKDVMAQLLETGRASSNQGAVWDYLDAEMDARQVASPTRAMADYVESQANALRAYRQALPYPAGACGVVVAIDGRFVAMDVFDSPATLEAIWPRLVDSYAIDAQRQGPTRPGGQMEEERGPQGEGAGNEDGKANSAAYQPPGTGGNVFSKAAAAVLLEQVAEQVCRAHRSPGMGQDLRFEVNHIFGQALVVDGRSLHLSVFAREPSSRRDRRTAPRFRPPSSRRR